MIQVGLTGNVASGKTTVARIWAEAGVPVVSADELAREAVAPGSAGLEEVVRAFGEEVTSPAGGLDRERMRAIAFQDPEARRRLELLLHPRIAELRRRWVEERRREGCPLAVSEIPLLFEAGLDDDFDFVVLVDAPPRERERRLVHDRGLSPEEARRIMAAQGDPVGKRDRADHVLANDDTPEALEEAALKLLRRLQEIADAGAREGKT